MFNIMINFKNYYITITKKKLYYQQYFMKVVKLYERIMCIQFFAIQILLLLINQYKDIYTLYTESICFNESREVKE